MTLVNVPVSEGTRVYLNFSVSLEDGSEVDSNFGGDPVDFVIGDGSLLPGNGDGVGSLDITLDGGTSGAVKVCAKGTRAIARGRGSANEN